MEEQPPTAKHHYIVSLIILFAIVGVTVVLLKLLSSPAPLPNQNSSVVQTEHLKDPQINPDLFASGLQSPTAITSTPSTADKRLFVLEQSGKIRVINQSGELESEAFLDISSKTLSGGELGLLGLAFHPKYEANGYFYVDYTDKEMNTVVSRFKVSANSNIADANSEKVLLSVKQPYKNHNGGAVVFGPDNYLYIALGDGGSAGDPENRAQDKNSFFGKLLRIDINTGEPYSIPKTNPFMGQLGVKQEVWAYGLRNPWRVSFDRATGDLYIADVGQGELEEVDMQKKSSKGGENYGWRCYEADKPYNNKGCADASHYIAPPLSYDHQEKRCSITGGYVYRGTKYKALQGKYIYGDYCNGQLFYANNQNGKLNGVAEANTPYYISTFGQGDDGEIYFADYKTGNIYHIQDTANP
jgi:glucose/arabinose dehydrogenase